MNSYNYSALTNALFLDIEAVREYSSFEEFVQNRNLENWKKIAAKHYSDVLKSDIKPSDPDIYHEKAGLYAEYGKVVCIGLGMATINLSGGTPVVSKKMYALTSHTEYPLIVAFAEQLEKAYDKNPNTFLCGHNILEYDIPFLVKRMIKYKIKVPQILKKCIFGKPWEINVVDTMRDWKMNTSKMVSMDTICEFIGVPSSKHGEVNGKNLGDYYFNNKAKWTPESERTDPILVNIADYCKLDVSNVIDIFAYLCEV